MTLKELERIQEQVDKIQGEVLRLTLLVQQILEQIKQRGSPSH